MNSSELEDADFTFLHVILPESFDFIITEFCQGNKPTEFYCILRLAIFTKDEALKWLKKFEETSLTKWRCERSHKECTPKLIFKKEYHCHHNTKPKLGSTPHIKHTDCHSKLTITVKQFMKRSEDIYLKTHPCQVNIRFIHNHDFTTAALKLSRSRNAVKKVVVEDLLDHSSSSTLQISEVKSVQGEEYFKENVSSNEPPEEPVSNDSVEQIHDLDKCADELNSIFQVLNKKLFENPSVYVEPIATFIENFKTCKTESSIISALHTFGKCSDMHVIKKSKHLQGEGLTVVQQPEIAKRKIKAANKKITKSEKPLKIPSIDGVHGCVKENIVTANSPHLLINMAKPYTLSLPVNNFL